MNGNAKEILRAQALEARKHLGSEVRSDASRAVARRVAALDCFARARTVALYAPFGSEVDPLSLTAIANASSHRFAFPRIEKDARALAFAVCAPQDLVPGPFGTREPPGGALTVALDELDLVLVPGVAFDLEGGRVGRGGGYYDATLSLLALRTRRLGLAFEVQLVAQVPREPHDGLLDGVVTEARTVLRGGAAQGPPVR